VKPPAGADREVSGKDDHLARASGGVGREAGAVGGDAAPTLADGAAAEHGLRRQADEDVNQSVVAQSVDSSARYLHLFPSFCAAALAAAEPRAAIATYIDGARDRSDSDDQLACDSVSVDHTQALKPPTNWETSAANRPGSGLHRWGRRRGDDSSYRR
jgi:hypothetical protein